MNHEETKIRSLHDRNWYWISKLVICRYGRILRSSGLAVYNVLASYANARSQACFPTQQTIANKVRLSRETVNRKIGLLKDLGLIRNRRLKGHCLYFLLKPEVILDHPRCDERITRYVFSDHTNNNKEKKLINNNEGRLNKMLNIKNK